MAISVVEKSMQKRPCMITYKIAKTTQVTLNFLIHYKHFYFILFFGLTQILFTVPHYIWVGISFTFSVPVSKSPIYLFVPYPILDEDKKIEPQPKY